MNRLLAGLVLAFSLLAAPPEAGAEIAFGARTQIWPFLFTGKPLTTSDEKTKLAVTLGNLDQYHELGVTWNIVDVWQEVDGPDGFQRLDRVVAEHERRGIQVAFRLLERPEIYDQISRGGAERNEALRQYGEWTRDIARRFGPRARYYMISNEADHDIGYNRPVYRAFRRISVNEYHEILRAAFEAIHSIDERLKVTDHGLTSYSLGLAVMADMVLDGHPGDALQFWRSMEYESPGEAERTLPRLLGMLTSSESRRRIDFARRSTSELADVRDAFQLHHYYGPDVVPQILGWIRGRLATGGHMQPILAAEVGYSIPAKRGKSWDGRAVNIADQSRYSASNHGTSIAKTIVTLAGNDVSDILYWQLRFHDPYHGPAASLFPDSAKRDEFRATHAVAVFKYLVDELSGLTPIASATSAASPDTLPEYAFQREGRPVLTVLWAKSQGKLMAPAALRAQATAVSDLAGRAIQNWQGYVDDQPVMVHAHGE